MRPVHEIREDCRGSSAMPSASDKTDPRPDIQSSNASRPNTPVAWWSGCLSSGSGSAIERRARVLDHANELPSEIFPIVGDVRVQGLLVIRGDRSRLWSSSGTGRGGTMRAKQRVQATIGEAE